MYFGNRNGEDGVGKINNLGDLGAIVLIQPIADVILHEGPDTCQKIDHDYSFSIRVDGHFFVNGQLVGISGRVFVQGCCFGGLICSAINRCDGDDWKNFANGQTHFKVGMSRAQLVEGIDPRLDVGTKLQYPYFSSTGRMFCRWSPSEVFMT